MNFLSQKDVYLKWKDEAERLQEDNERLNVNFINFTCLSFEFHLLIRLS